jgi:hypothetical protein
MLPASEQACGASADAQRLITIKHNHLELLVLVVVSADGRPTATTFPFRMFGHVGRTRLHK